MDSCLISFSSSFAGCQHPSSAHPLQFHLHLFLLLLSCSLPFPHHFLIFPDLGLPSFLSSPPPTFHPFQLASSCVWSLSPTPSHLGSSHPDLLSLSLLFPQPCCPLSSLSSVTVPLPVSPASLVQSPFYFLLFDYYSPVYLNQMSPTSPLPGYQQRAHWRKRLTASSDGLVPPQWGLAITGKIVLSLCSSRTVVPNFFCTKTYL